MRTSSWMRKRQKTRTRTRLWLAGTLMLYFLVLSSVLALRASWKGWNPALGPDQHGDDTPVPGTGRRTDEGRGGEERRLMRQRREEGAPGGRQNFSISVADDVDDDDDDEAENCTPRAINNFPDNFFSLEKTQDGLVFVHVLIALYLFAALALVCDDYFVPALERICDDLGLQEDVAGATFMAAGSSAPELCTSIVGVFIAQSDVGVGTIVGSAVFNILFIIGVCGIFAGMVVDLTWYPLVRDTLFYLLSVLALVLVIEDSRVHWYEALAMLLLYGLYIVLMYFNRRLENRAMGAVDTLRARWKGHGGPVDPEEKQGLLEGRSMDTDAGETDNGGGRGSVGASGGSREIETRFGSTGASHEEKSGEVEENKYESPWEIPDTYLARVYWVAMTPVRALCYITVPDCRRQGRWRRLYPITFLTSVVWIGGFTYVMVWMITIAGDALDIPDTVMGLTLLAAGTSLPDCMASILVARDGYGDMAVSNSIGSNVFDILLCLGLPWLIDTAAVQGGGSLEIVSSGLLYSSLTLLATVIFLLVSVGVNRWRLTKAYGALCLLVYVGVITLSSLYELNVFGDLNPPACPR